MNPTTLERLAASGSDLSRPHRLINVFHVAREDRVAHLCAALEAAHFVIEDRGTPASRDGEPHWLVEALLVTLPDRQAVDVMTDRCVAIAARHLAEYDGWYTEVVR